MLSNLGFVKYTIAFPKGMIQSWPIHKIVWSDADGNILPDEYQDDVKAADWERQDQETMRQYRETMRKIGEDQTVKPTKKRGWFG